MTSATTARLGSAILHWPRSRHSAGAIAAIGVGSTLGLLCLVVAALLIGQATNAQQKIPANIVFANLSGPDMAAIVQEDAAAIGPLFRRSYVTPIGQV